MMASFLWNCGADNLKEILSQEALTGPPNVAKVVATNSCNNIVPVNTIEALK
jgi:hypothetical protein